MVNQSVTVLMAVYNAPVSELQQAIESIRTQTLATFEFLIIDDGSTNEQTIRFLDDATATDSRIRLVREGHRGLTMSLNRGLELAKGRFIARQDADDWSHPERLSRQLRFLSTSPVAVLCGSNAWTHQQNGFRLWRTRLPLTPAGITAALPHGNPFVHGATMFTRRAALAVGGYRPEFRCSQDYDFFWRLSETGLAYNLEDPLYHYRYSAGSVSANKAAEQGISHKAAVQLAKARGEGLSQDPSQVIAALRESERPGHHALLKEADHLMLAGAYLSAAHAYLELLRQHPASPIAWAKLARLGVFVAMPSAREACFR